MDIILYLLTIIQEQHQQICWLILFICRYIPLKQWAHDEIHSPAYQKFTTDKLPIIKPFVKQDWQLWVEYYRLRYGYVLKPVKPQKGKTHNVPEDTVCPLCGAPHEYIYDNNGGRGQFQCKVCGQTFVTGEQVTSPLKLQCPYCNHALQPIKDRKHFRVYKCINDNCSFYKHNQKNFRLTSLRLNTGNLSFATSTGSSLSTSLTWISTSSPNGLLPLSSAIKVLTSWGCALHTG